MNIEVNQVHVSAKKLAQGYVPPKFVAIVKEGDVVVHRTHNHTTERIARLKAEAYCIQRGIDFEPKL